jgi:hypothetical protein
MVPLRPRPHAVALAGGILLVLLGSTAPVLGSNPSGAPYYQEVWAGVDSSFDSTQHPYMGHFDYVGDDEGPLQSCVRVAGPGDERTNVPTCWADRASGGSKARVHLRTFEEQYRDPDARAGVGFAYHLQPRCDGQVWDGDHPLTLTMDYQRAVAVGTQGGGVAFAEVWGNPVRGRGYEGATDPLQPPAPVDPDMVNRRLGFWEGTTSLALQQAPPAVFQFVPEAEGDYQALVYSHAHGTVAGAATDALAHAQVDLDLTRVAFDWTDEVPPTIESVSWQGTAPAPARDGLVWWTDWPQLNVRADDDFSCPHQVHWASRAGGPSPVGAVCWSNKVCNLLFQGEGRYHGDVWVTDGQGNPSTTTHEVRTGVDASAPAVTVETVPAAPDGRDGWFLAAPRLRFTCLDAFSGCDKVVWADAGLQQRTLAFPVTPGVPATVETAPLPAGYNNRLCSAYDLARWTTSCALEVKVDLTPPSTSFRCSRVADFSSWWPCSGGGWERVDVWVRAHCSEPGVSNHHLTARIRPPGGDWVDGAGPVHVPAGAHGTVKVVEAACSDPAGHVTPASYAAGTDTEGPALPAVTERGGRTLFPRGSGPLLDFPATDAHSGMNHYLVHRAGRTECYVLEPACQVDPAPTGEHVVVVEAHDNAGNVATLEFAYASDADPPEAVLSSPHAGMLYLPGLAVPVPGLPKAIAVGTPIRMDVHAADAQSGLDHARVVAALTSVQPHQQLGTLLDCTTVTTYWCSGSFQPPAPTSLTAFRDYLRTYNFELQVRDRAGNAEARGVAVDYVSLVAGGAKTAAGIPYVGLDWAKYEGGDFLRYEIHRGLTADFQPTLATKVAETAMQGSQSFRDKTAVVDQVYFYAVKVVTSSGSAMTNVYPAKVPGGVTEPDRPNYLDREPYMA